MRDLVGIMMSSVLISTAAIAASGEQPEILPQLPEGKAWKLTWNDEFDGKEIDVSKWELPENERRGHLWRPANAYLDGKPPIFVSMFREVNNEAECSKSSKVQGKTDNTRCREL